MNTVRLSMLSSAQLSLERPRIVIEQTRLSQRCQLLMTCSLAFRNAGRIEALAHLESSSAQQLWKSTLQDINPRPSAPDLSDISRAPSQATLTWLRSCPSKILYLSSIHRTAYLSSALVSIGQILPCQRHPQLRRSAQGTAIWTQHNSTPTRPKQARPGQKLGFHGTRYILLQRSSHLEVQWTRACRNAETV